MSTRSPRSSRTSEARRWGRAPRSRGAADASPAASRSPARGHRSRRRPRTTGCTRTRCITWSSPRMPASTAARLLDGARVPALDRSLDADAGIELAMLITGAAHAFLYLHPAATGARSAAESALADRGDIEITLGPGGFMGGEESALLNVLESKRAMARQRPPYPALQGYLMRPTLVSSAETLAWLPLVLEGAKA